MAKISISALKNAFMTLKKPSQQDFYNIFDSFMHIDNAVGLANATIDARITAYDLALRAVTPGTINTLGDVLKVLEDFPDTGNIKALLDAAGGAPSWSSIQNRPNNVSVTWSEQMISNNWFGQGWNGVMESIPTKSLADIAGLSGGEKWLLKDLYLQSFPVQVAGLGVTVYANRVSAFTIAKSIKVDLTTV